jgi:hypothetical protein
MTAGTEPGIYPIEPPPRRQGRYRESLNQKQHASDQKFVKRKGGRMGRRLLCSSRERT